MLCRDNQKHIEEIEPEYIKGITFHYVGRMSEVLEVALGIGKGAQEPAAKRKKKT
jgi:ATP-dependent Lon protease